MNADRLEPLDFAVVKEYLRLGKTREEVAEIVGLSVQQVQEIQDTRYYKEYQGIQDKRISQELLSEYF